MSFRGPPLPFVTMQKLIAALLLLTVATLTTGCGKVAVPAVMPVSKVTRANYDQVRMGMTRSQVETILGQPTSVDTKDFVVYKKTIYRYEDGAKFIQVTFKNDELDGKDGNL